MKQQDIFKWLLALSFFTDLIDGYLARKFKVTSIWGARLDSIADDLTIAAGMIGMIVFNPGFVKEELESFILLFSLFFIQTGYAFYRYKKTTSFHTILAKISAICQGTFLILFFFLPNPSYILFYTTVIITAIELLEEIILVSLIPKWKTNVKGIYWFLQKQKKGK
jgi:CDP-diacylglycerol--glycerol-3-phosphate 3-phosphatidyltransferase